MRAICQDDRATPPASSAPRSDPPSSVVLLGPRQAGKTTLARIIAREQSALCLELESEVDRSRLDDAQQYLAEHADKLVVLDEAQHLPRLFETLRGLIDEGRRGDRRTGRFLLLGSASLDLLRQSRPGQEFRADVGVRPRSTAWPLTARRPYTLLLACRGVKRLVLPSGTATYYFRYTSSAGERQRLKIGRRSVMSPADAFRRVELERQKVCAGVDPMAEAANAKADAARRKNSIMFAALWTKRKAEDDRRALRTMSDYDSAMNLDILPSLEKRLAGEISQDDLADVLQVVAERSRTRRTVPTVPALHWAQPLM